MALLASAHGVAELAIAGHVEHKELNPCDIIDALVDLMTPRA